MSFYTHYQIEMKFISPNWELLGWKRISIYTEIDRIQICLQRFPCFKLFVFLPEEQHVGQSVFLHDFTWHQIEMKFISPWASDLHDT